ncbi:unnamed protein product [Phytophthora fragariaefolia]|uniref:Unnamed protein product n=1 Tax=Phytophthora fragariaefolia TaxID=1490495 RepID=A0A9W6XJ78_9STRA|nr:unnamed protein product [Phytophthora fragariaefolia]
MGAQKAIRGQGVKSYRASVLVTHFENPVCFWEQQHGEGNGVSEGAGVSSGDGGMVNEEDGGATGGGGMVDEEDALASYDGNSEVSSSSVSSYEITDEEIPPDIDAAVVEHIDSVTGVWCCEHECLTTRAEAVGKFIAGYMAMTKDGQRISLVTALATCAGISLEGQRHRSTGVPPKPNQSYECHAKSVLLKKLQIEIGVIVIINRARAFYSQFEVRGLFFV